MLKKSIRYMAHTCSRQPVRFSGPGAGCVQGLGQLLDSNANAMPRGYNSTATAIAVSQAHCLRLTRENACRNSERGYVEQAYASDYKCCV